MTDRIERGRAGEEAACDYLRKEGYLICELNWRSGHHEVDIIAQRYDEIHFVEVRTRATGSMVAPEETLSANKRRALRQAAAHYMAITRSPFEPRFDLIAIDADPMGGLHLRFIADAIEAHW